MQDNPCLDIQIHTSSNMQTRSPTWRHTTMSGIRWDMHHLHNQSIMHPQLMITTMKLLQTMSSLTLIRTILKQTATVQTIRVKFKFHIIRMDTRYHCQCTISNMNRTQSLKKFYLHQDQR
uniref:Uncharacterized protein n=1 Tax=Cacopsylla melanoneura TaxID=428564 RepID=A0A8D8WT13_9HEMI